MKATRIGRHFPGWKNAAAAGASGLLLALSFPDLELWYLAFAALIPLFWAIENECDRVARPFALGWLWGMVFFLATCWWLTFAPITYAGMPTAVAYFLLICAAAAGSILPAIFGLLFGILRRRFGTLGILSAPFVWVAVEYLRYWVTGNNWNSVGYSQFESTLRHGAAIGGVLYVGAVVILVNVFGLLIFKVIRNDPSSRAAHAIGPTLSLIAAMSFPAVFYSLTARPKGDMGGTVIAIQPNVPMSGLTYEKWMRLRQRHVDLAETALASAVRGANGTTTVIFPESPMNFAFEEDEEFQRFVHAFAAKHDVNVLFNSAEPDIENKKYFNSAVLVGTDGREVAQYDKIYLLPFGETVPAPLRPIVPAFVGSFSFGKEYDLLPLGDAKAGVMICFESHFGELSREYVRRGADAIIEMTNDGYLGPTPVLRQHLANAVFRAVETNRPVLRVTNIGITAYINERGEILDAAPAYQEDTRVWGVSKSDGSRTFYVKHGDWFAWLSSILTVGLLVLSRRRKVSAPPQTGS
jgi:apolipoprotein N-acyltransferase